MLKYNYEFAPEEKIRLGYLGCGGHSYRNLFPCLRYLPVELVAVCDLDIDRARAFAGQFGAAHACTDYEQMLAEYDLDAVMIVTGYDEGGVTHAPRAIEALDAGCHAFVEKPPANSAAEIEQIIAAERRTDKFAMVGFKKAFFPAVARARRISQQDEFGGISSIYARYPQTLPACPEKRQDRSAMRGFLDHVVHPGSILYFVGGPMQTVTFSIDPAGGSVGTIRFESGAIGNLHLVGGMSGTSPLERLEIVGSGANVVVDNGVHLTYYRPGGRGEGGYGRSASFIGDDESAPLTWEPEFSLGQLYNSGLFLLGYFQELQHFCDCVRDDRRPDRANTDWALALMQLYEAYRGPEGTVITIGEGA